MSAAFFLICLKKKEEIFAVFKKKNTSTFRKLHILD